MKTLDELVNQAKASAGPPEKNNVIPFKAEPENANSLALKLQLYGSLLIGADDRQALVSLRKQCLAIVDAIDVHFLKKAGLL
jgi:hypothetical protein